MKNCIGIDVAKKYFDLHILKPAKTDNLSRRRFNGFLALPAKQMQFVACKTEYMTVKQSFHAQQVLRAFTSINW